MFKLGEIILKNIGKIGKGPSLKEVFKQSGKKSLKSGGKVGKFAKGTAKTAGAGGALGVGGFLGGGASGILSSILGGGKDQGVPEQSITGPAGQKAMDQRLAEQVANDLDGTGGFMGGGGGGGVQTAPESISIQPGKSVLDQILGVLVSIKQDTVSVVSGMESDDKEQARAREKFEAKKKESQTEGARSRLQSVKDAVTTVTTGVKKGLSGIAKGVAGLFAVDTLSKVLTGQSVFDNVGDFFGDEEEKNKKVYDKPIGPMMESSMDVPIHMQSMSAQLKDATETFTQGFIDTVFLDEEGKAKPFGPSVKKLGLGITKFLNFLNPANLLTIDMLGMKEELKKDIPQFMDAFEYTYGKEGESSPLLEDLINISKKLGMQLKKSFTIKPEVKEEFNGFMKSLETGFLEFNKEMRESIENTISEIGATLAETFENIRDFFKEKVGNFFDSFKRIEKSEPASLDDTRNQVINELTFQKQAGFERKAGRFGGPKVFTKEYDDLTENEKALVDKRVKDIMKKDMEERKGSDDIRTKPDVFEFGENNTNKESLPEKQQSKMNLGETMRFYGMDPKPIVAASNQFNSPTTNASTVNNNTSVVNSQQKITKGGGDGSIGTRNGDTSLYSGLTPGFMQGARG